MNTCTIKIDKHYTLHPDGTDNDDDDYIEANRLFITEGGPVKFSVEGSDIVVISSGCINADGIAFTYEEAADCLDTIAAMFTEGAALLRKIGAEKEDGGGA